MDNTKVEGSSPGLFKGLSSLLGEKERLAKHFVREGVLNKYYKVRNIFLEREVRVKMETGIKNLDGG